MMYLDTNIFVYAILNDLKYGEACKKILQDVQDERIDVVCSNLVLAELINVLVKIRKSNKGIDVKKSVQAVMSLPIKWFDMNLFILENAAEYKYNLLGTDYVHIATMEINSITKIISADAEFDSLDTIKRIDPLNYA